MQLAERVSRIQPSLTLELSAKASALAKAGHPVINLTVGEPDFPTPRHVRQAAFEAMEKGLTKYTPSAGIVELRTAVANRLNETWGTAYEPRSIVMGSGAKESLANAVLATCQMGDEVLIPAPYWLSYPEMVRLAHATPVFIPTRLRDEFKLSPECLKEHLTPRSRLIIINSPSNPTGVAYDREELDALIPLILEHRLWVISDEIYSRLLYDGRPHFSLAAHPEIRDQLILVDGWSKAYAMTGWRIGFLAAPAQVSSAVIRMQSHTTSHPSSISQWAALAALTGPEDDLHAMVREFERRRDMAYEHLTAIPDLPCRKPEGAFYLFADASGYVGAQWKGKSIDTSLALCEYLLEEQRLAMVPGSVFGAEGFIRLSYAAQYERVAEGIERLASGLAALRR
ncbi:MAG: pyridoxal phosphate-dependent aminotransferase [Candidatus Eisenbacteria bacterium]|nr:pyridoxal phosphate-dependent aminotransferase [Candidatus Eisenbacteria bacterium]